MTIRATTGSPGATRENRDDGGDRPTARLPTARHDAGPESWPESWREAGHVGQPDAWAVAAARAQLLTHRLSRRPPPVLSGLLVPADPAGVVRVVAVTDASAAISDLLGSVLLDDVVTWATPGGVWVSVYLGKDRATAPDNPRLSLIATRLGLTDRAFHAAARGDALILGTGPTGADEDLPSDVVAEVGRCGVTVENAQGMAAGACRPWWPCCSCPTASTSPEAVR
jgi:hypothetical protein